MFALDLRTDLTNAAVIECVKVWNCLLIMMAAGQD